MSGGTVGAKSALEDVHPDIAEEVRRLRAENQRLRNDTETARVNADLGNRDAWDRLYRAQAENEALRALCQEVVADLFPGGLMSWDPADWRRRLFVAATGGALVALPTATEPEAPR